MGPGLVVSLVALASPAFAGIHEIWWNITYVENASPDGLFERRAIGVNNGGDQSLVKVMACDTRVTTVTPQFL